MDHLFFWKTPEQIAKGNGHLSVAQVHAALSYYFDHEKRLDAFIQSLLSDASLDGFDASASTLAGKIKAVVESKKRLLAIAGTWTDEEAEEFRKNTECFNKIDWEMWT